MRAGADIADLEFVQFHPTVMWLGPFAQGQQPLVSEAVRGEGAFLIDAEGTRFMIAEHEMADLAPRDVVAKAIMRRMRATNTDHVWLDARHLGADMWVQRFPTILESCRSRGIDPVTDLIPVSPAQHYVSGGVLTDLAGRTSIPGLYACGEVACTGVHGANRLASNSLLEGLVFAGRIGAEIAKEPRIVRDPILPSHPDQRLLPHQVRRRVQTTMDRHVGVLRSAESLQLASAELNALAATEQGKPIAEDWETTNIVTIATALTQHALLREETRGSHWREDFPERNDDQWQVRLVSNLKSDGTLTTRKVPRVGVSYSMKGKND
jgi:L-aspartate oxidase